MSDASPAVPEKTVTSVESGARSGSPKCFVIMPFSDKEKGETEYPKDHWTDVYKKLIQPSVQQEHQECIRADENFCSNHRVKYIFDMIREANLVLCDLSSQNPNVFIELGYALSGAKHLVLINDNCMPLPFQLSDLGHVVYSHELTRKSLSDDRKKLSGSIRQTLASPPGPLYPTTPVSTVEERSQPRTPMGGSKPGWKARPWLEAVFTVGKWRLGIGVFLAIGVIAACLIGKGILSKTGQQLAMRSVSQGDGRIDGSITAAWQDLEARSVRVEWKIARLPPSISKENLYLATTAKDRHQYWRKTKISSLDDSHVFGLSEGQSYVSIVSPTVGPMKDEMAGDEIEVIAEAELPK